MTDPQRTAAPPDHERHDLSIVATLAARPADLDEREAAAARAQAASCAACAEALADFVALQSALPGTATPRRPRDFQLTPGDAQRLHRGGWRRFLGYFGSPRDGFSRPLAIGLTTLGLAGVLLASIPSATLMGGSGGAAPANEAAPIQQAAPAPAASAPGTDRTALGAAAPGGALPSAAPSASTAAAASTSSEAGTASTEAATAPTDTQVFTGGNPDEVAPDIAGGVDSALRDETSGFSVLFVVGGVLLIAGLGLFALRWSARRLS
ncbi:MAG TPA: hypothetical protein VFN41_02490 [Candidatus Limnocylindrales bacterium]|nr:hypothetical protein [Candidatus Limnocylindrales bacterium]